MEAVQELSAKKKRVRRRMVNGVLIGGTNKQDIDLDNSLKIQDLGEDCQCKRFRCFDVTTNEERLRVFKWFRELGSIQMQDLYLSNLITAEGVKQRRPKLKVLEAGKKSEHSASYFYKLKIPDVDQRGYRELSVCRVAFLGILGISRNRLRTTQMMMTKMHQKRPVQPMQPSSSSSENEKVSDDFVPEPLELLIISQIDNYALSETYSVKAMHRHFLRSYRINVPYHIYWVVFHAKWNIAQFQPKYTCLPTPTFDTFYETMHMFGLVDFNTE